MLDTLTGMHTNLTGPWRRSVWSWLAANYPPLLLAGAHLVLAIWYSTLIPIFEASDENNHFFFVRQLALAGHIPDVRYESGPWGQQATQGPLFYATAALPVSLVDANDAIDLIAHFNPLVNLGDGTRPGNKNAWVHDPSREAWPWRGAVLAVHVARWVSALYGALTVWSVYLLVRRLSPRAAGTAAAMAAFLPQFIWAAGSVTNETAIAATSALSLCLLVSMRPDWPKRYWVGLGAVLGLAALAKTPGVILAGYAIGILGIQLLPHGWRQALGQIGLVALGFGLLAGPWLIMNSLRYGDPTGLSGHLSAINNAQAQLFRPDSLNSFLTLQFIRLIPGYIIAAFASLWGVFGLHNILAPAAVYEGFNDLALLGLLGFCLSFGWPVGKLQLATRSRQLWLSGWLALHLATLVFWAYRSGGGPGRLLFPALPVIVLICATGWLRLTGWLRFKPLAYALRGLFPGLLGVFALVAPAWLITPAYATPPALAELPSSAKPLYLHYGVLELVGIESQTRVEPGDEFAVTFYWRLTQPTSDEYLVFPRVLDGNLTPVAGTNGYPGWGNWPVILWKPGVIYADRYVLPVAPDALRPSLGRVIVAAERNRVSQTILAVDGNPFDPTWPLADVAFAPDLAGLKDLPGLNPLATFGGAAALVAAHYPETARPGETISIELLWQARQPIGESWQRFVHLDDGDRSQPKITAQNDSLLANGYGTAWWQSDETIPDAVVLVLSADLPAGQYALWVGLTHADGSRINVAGGDSQDDRLYLGAITIQ